MQGVFLRSRFSTECEVSLEPVRWWGGGGGGNDGGPGKCPALLFVYAAERSLVLS